MSKLLFKAAAARATLGKEQSFKDFSPEAKRISYIRHKFDAKIEQFVEDVVEGEIEPCAMSVKLEGATRELYRMKIYTKWRGCDSYVAKRYRSHVDATKEMYFADCQMQMVAKKVAEEYNKLKPPNRIDFLECFVIEYRQEGQESLFWCCEKFVQGDYMKHSSNSGFVEEAHHRMTPHAFSHYSYLLSGGKRMIVDIQGVGNLWTDPQVHCIDKPREFGVGNLGLAGIAKFFKTYRFNPLCEWIGLVPFQHSPTGQEAELGDLDWEAASRDYKLAYLAAKPNPYRNAIAKRCSTLGGDVHFMLARMYEQGSFGDVDMESAVFHVERAAKLGDGDANVVLAKAYAGIARDTLQEYRVQEDPEKAFSFWLTAAKAGNLEAMSQVANYYDGTFSVPNLEVDYKQAVSWYMALVQRHEQLDESADLSEDDFELHRILAKTAALHEIGGFGLARSARTAYDLYSQAAEVAEEMMKSKLASKYYDKAAELEAEFEEEALSEDAASPHESMASTAHWSVNKSVYHGEGGLESLADGLMAALDDGGDVEGALQVFRAAFKTYKAAIHQEERAEVDATSAVKTWVCMCRLNPHKEGELLRVTPERLKYLVANGEHVRMAGALNDSSALPKVMQYVLHMTKEDAEEWLATEPLAKAGCYESIEIYEMQQHWSNIAA